MIADPKLGQRVRILSVPQAGPGEITHVSRKGSPRASFTVTLDRPYIDWEFDGEPVDGICTDRNDLEEA